MRSCGAHGDNSNICESKGCFPGYDYGKERSGMHYGDSDPNYIEQRTAVRNYEQRKEVLKNIGTTRTIARFVRDLFWKGRK